MIDFIFMLTRHDRTIEDCLQTFDYIKELGIRHVGFKDIGVDFATLRELNARIKASGAVSYMEVVSTTSEDCLASARAALEIGVDRLLGGTEVAAMQAILGDSPIEYLPFPGRPEGHPTTLRGGPKDVAEDCRAFQEKGCAGADLLAYRASEAEPLELVRAARESMDGYLVVAGSIDSPARIHALDEAGADAFTIGSAVFDGSFSRNKGLISSQLRDVLAACG